MTKEKLIKFNEFFIKNRPEQEIATFLNKHIDQVEDILKISIFKYELYNAKLLKYYDKALLLKLSCRLPRLFNSNYSSYRLFEIASKIVINEQLSDFARGIFCKIIIDMKIDKNYFYCMNMVSINRCINDEELKNGLNRLIFGDNEICNRILWRVLWDQAYFYKANDFLRKLPTTIFQSIENDNVAAFCINKTLYNKKTSLLLLLAIIEQMAINILCYLIENDKKIFSCCTAQDLTLLLCQKTTDEFAIKALKSIEKMYPNTISTSCDNFGNTPLWYTLYKSNDTLYRGNFKAHSNDLIQFLIDNGCNPQYKNVFKISYETVGKALKEATTQGVVL